MKTNLQIKLKTCYWVKTVNNMDKNNIDLYIETGPNSILKELNKRVPIIKPLILMNYNLKNKVILITGASKGIGKSISTKLAQNGAKVVLLINIEN